MISSLYFEALIEKIFEKVSVEYTFNQGIVYTSCAADFPSVSFMFGEKWIEASPKDYLYQINDAGTQCILFIMPVNLPMNIIGMPLFVDYYSVHDPVLGQVSWAPHTASTKSSLVTGSIPPKSQVLRIGEATSEVDGNALLLAWALTALFVYLVLDWWGQFLRPEWQKTMTDGDFILSVAAFFTAVFLAGIFIIQPLAYDLVYSGLSSSAEG